MLSSDEAKNVFYKVKVKFTGLTKILLVLQPSEYLRQNSLERICKYLKVTTLNCLVASSNKKKITLFYNFPSEDAAL